MDKFLKNYDYNKNIFDSEMDIASGLYKGAMNVGKTFYRAGGDALNNVLGKNSKNNRENEEQKIIDDQIHIYVLYELSDNLMKEFKLFVYLGNKRPYMEMISSDTKALSNGDRLRLYKLECKKIDMGNTFKFGFYKLGLSNFSLSENEFRDLDESLYYFIFDMDIAIDINKPGPNGKTKFKKSYMLLYYSKYLLSQNNWEIAIPLLLEQYKKNCEIDNEEWEQETASSLVSISKHILLSGISFENKLKIVLDFFSCFFVGIFSDNNLLLDICQDINEKNINDISSVLALAFKLREEKWIKFSQCPKNDSQFSILLKAFAENGIKLKDNDSKIFTDLVCQFPSGNKIEKIVLLSSMLIFLNNMYLYFEKSAMEKDIIILNINEYAKNNSITIENISDIFEMLDSLKSSQFNALISESNLKTKIQSSLKNLDSTKDKTIFLKNIFDPHDYELLGDLNSHQMCINIINNSLAPISLSDLYRTFNLAKDKWEDIFSKWLEKYEFHTNISYIDDFFCLILDNELKTSFYRILDKKFQYENNINANMISWASYFDNCKEKLLKIRYITFICNKKIRNYKKCDLTNLGKNNGRSEVFEILENYLQCSLIPYISANIINGSYYKDLLILFNNKDYVEETDKFLEIEKSVLNIWNDIKTEMISIYKLQQIFHQNEGKDFLKILKYFSAKIEDNFEIILENKLMKYKEIAETVMRMNSFICFLCEKWKFTKVSNMKKEYDRYNEKKLSEFCFEQKSEYLRQLSKQIAKFLNSRLYKKEYESLIYSIDSINDAEDLKKLADETKNYQENRLHLNKYNDIICNIDSESIISSAERAFESMRQKLHSILDNAPNLTIKGQEIEYLLSEDESKLPEILTNLFGSDEKSKIDQLKYFLDKLKIKRKLDERFELLQNLEKIIGVKYKFLNEIDLAILNHNFKTLLDLQIKKEDIRLLDKKMIISKENNNKIFELIRKMTESPDLWSLVKEIEKGVIDRLKINFDLFGKDYNNIQLIIDLEAVWNLFTNIYQLVQQNSKDLYASLYQIIENALKENELIGTIIINCRDKIDYYRALKENLYINENTKIKQISSILAKSVIKLNFLENELKFELLSETRKFDLQSIIDLRDWFLLVNRRTNEENEYSEFESLIDMCTKSTEILNALYNLGYPNFDLPLIEIKCKNFLCTWNNEFDKMILAEYQLKLQKEYSDWIESLEKCYKNILTWNEQKQRHS